MHDYLIIILDNGAAQAQVAPADMQKFIAGDAEFGKGLRASGIYRDGERSGQKPSVFEANTCSTGPSPRPKEALGGYYVVRAESLRRPRRSRNAVRCLTVIRSKCAEVMKGELQPVKTDKPGKVFAFAVVGTTA